MRTLTIPQHIKLPGKNGEDVDVRFVEDVLFGHVLTGFALRDDPVAADDLAQLFEGRGPGDEVKMLDELFEKGKRAFLRPDPEYAPAAFPRILRFLRAWAEAKASAEETK